MGDDSDGRIWKIAIGIGTALGIGGTWLLSRRAKGEHGKHEEEDSNANANAKEGKSLDANMKLNARQRFGDILCPFEENPCEIIPSISPPYSFRCSGEAAERRPDGVFIRLEDEYGIVKLGRFSDSPQDELFIPGKPSTGVLFGSFSVSPSISSSTVAFADKSGWRDSVDERAPFSVENDINDYASVEWKKIAWILKQRENIATLYTENSKHEACIVDQNEDGMFVRFDRPPMLALLPEVDELPCNPSSIRAELERHSRNWKRQLHSCLAAAPYALIPSMQLDMNQYRNCRCEIEIVKTVLDDLSIYGRIIRLHDQEIRRRANLKANIELLCKGTLILDTCIWESEQKHSDFFDILLQTARKRNFKIMILDEIYTEIRNHVNSDDAKKHNIADHAKIRIEEFQKAHCVSIERSALENDSKNAKTYADRRIRNFAMESAKKGRLCAIVTDDRDLRIRIRGLAQELLSPVQQKFIRCLSLHDICNGAIMQDAAQTRNAKAEESGGRN